jgi:RNA polymerase sigma-70 factor (ECF subfamily)
MLAGTLRRACIRLGESPEAVDDLLQDTYFKICADHGQILRKFLHQPEGAVYSYLKVIAVNLANDRFRLRLTLRRGGGKTVALAPQSEDYVPDPRNHAAETERDLLFDQIDRVLRANLVGSSAARDRAIFWLYYRQGLTSEAIAAIAQFHLTVKGVEAVIQRLGRVLRDRLGAQGPMGVTKPAGISSAEPLRKRDEQ